MSTFRRAFRTLLQGIGLLTLLGLLAAGAAALVLPRLLQVEDKLEKADYILPLAGESHRYFKAAQLYKEGYAPVVLLSNAYVAPPTRFDRTRVEMGIPEPDARALRRRLLRHLGVPANALVSFGDGHLSTVEEAEALRAFLRTREVETNGGPVRVILVTSPFHTRRARMTFADVVPETRFMVTSPPEYRLTAQWWRDRGSATLAVLETAKFVYYLLGGSFRSADSAQ